MKFKVVEDDNEYDEEYPLDEFDILLSEYFTPYPVFLIFILFTNRLKILLKIGKAYLMNLPNPTNYNIKL